MLVHRGEGHVAVEHLGMFIHQPQGDLERFGQAGPLQVDLVEEHHRARTDRRAVRIEEHRFDAREVEANAVDPSEEEPRVLVIGLEGEGPARVDDRSVYIVELQRESR